MDGFSNVADCDDSDPAVSPARDEICVNDKDDNCDGIVDEGACQTQTPTGGTTADAGAGRDGGGLLDGGDRHDSGTPAAPGLDEGCGCGVGGTSPTTPGLIVLSLLALLRRRRT